MASGGTDKGTPGSLVFNDSSSALQGTTPACSVLPGHPDYQEQRNPTATSSAGDGLSAQELADAMQRDRQFQGYMARRRSPRRRSATSRRSASSGSAVTPRRNLQEQFKRHAPPHRTARLSAPYGRPVCLYLDPLSTILSLESKEQAGVAATPPVLPGRDLPRTSSES